MVIFGVASAVSVVWLIVIPSLVFMNIDLTNREFLDLTAELRQQPEYLEAIAQIPESIREYVFAVTENTQQRITFLDNFLRWRWFLIAALYLVLTPLLYLTSLYFARRLTAPVKTVAAASRQLANGDLSTRVQTDTKSWDNYSLALADDFNHMAASLENYEEERQTMIGDIAHELRTPLTVMQADLESLQDGVDPLTPERVDFLYEETKLLSRLITDLRTLSLAEANQLSLDLSLIDFTKVVQKTVFRFHKEAAQKDIQFVTHLEEECFLTADAERLSQVLGNLLSNAIRHTPQGGTITVTLEQETSGFSLMVSDTGKGLSDIALQHVFDRFYRSDKGRVRSEGGSGLGLAIIKALVELHGGSVAASNREEGGAVFEVFLPNTD